MSHWLNSVSGGQVSCTLYGTLQTRAISNKKNSKFKSTDRSCYIIDKYKVIVNNKLVRAAFRQFGSQKAASLDEIKPKVLKKWARNNTRKDYWNLSSKPTTRLYAILVQVSILIRIFGPLLWTIPLVFTDTKIEILRDFVINTNIIKSIFQISGEE